MRQVLFLDVGDTVEGKTDIFFPSYSVHPNGTNTIFIKKICKEIYYVIYRYTWPAPHILRMGHSGLVKFMWATFIREGQKCFS